MRDYDIDNFMIGKRLKLARVNAGFTQLQLGVMAGLDEESSGPRISSYENEVHNPDFKFAIRLAKALDVPVTYFYALDDELAELILKYHKMKKKNPDTAIILLDVQRP